MENSPCVLLVTSEARWLSVSPGQMDSANLSWTIEVASCCHPCVELRGTSSQPSSRRGRAPLATSAHVGAKNPIPINSSRLELALTWIPPRWSSKAWSNSPAMTGWRALTIGKQSAQLAQHAADLEKTALASPTLHDGKKGAQCSWLLLRLELPATPKSIPSLWCRGHEQTLPRGLEALLSADSLLWSMRRKAGATKHTANLTLLGSFQKGRHGTGKLPSTVPPQTLAAPAVTKRVNPERKIITIENTKKMI